MIAGDEACDQEQVDAGMMSCAEGFLCSGGTCVVAACNDGEDDDNDGLTDAVTQTVAVPQPPVAGFTFTAADLDVTFTDASSDADGSVVAWTWDFGDGTSSSAQSPAHAYASGGAYNVTLTVTDNDGLTGAVTQSVTVTDPPVPPTADFTVSVTDRKSTRLNSSHSQQSRMPSSA